MGEKSGQRIPGTIAQDLGSQIVSGKYEPGAILEGEVAASLQRHVSRSAYREAVRILAAKGLVESRPKMGTRVSDRAKWNLLDPDVLSWMFSSAPSEELLASLFELRRMLEPEAARLAALRRTKHQIAEMEAAVDGMTRHGLDTAEGRQADGEFHTALLEASGNAFLITLTSAIGTAVIVTTKFKMERQALRDVVPEHRKVFDAIAAGDGNGAYQAMSDLVNMAYLSTAKARTKKNLDDKKA